MLLSWLKKLFRPGTLEYRDKLDEHRPVMPVNPPTSGPSTPAMEVDTESTDPERE